MTKAFASVALTLLTTWVPSAVQAAECELALEVLVVDEATAEALAQVHVTAQSKAKSVEFQPHGAPGNYVATNLCAGVYTLQVAREGFIGRRTQVTLPHAGSFSVALASANVAQLDDVIVEGAFLDRQSSHVLEGEALERTRGKPLAEALAQAPGVSVLRSGASTTPIVRGQFGRRLVMLVDRVRHESQKWGLDHAPEINPFNAGSLTVVKGAAGVRYGPDAVGGAILVDPHPLRSTPGYSGEAYMIGASNGLGATTALRLDGAPQNVPGLAWRVHGDIQRAAAMVTPDYALDNTGTRQWNLGFSVGYDRPNHSLKLSYQHHDALLGIFSGIRRATLTSFLDQIARDRPLGSEHFNASGTIERAYQKVSHDLAILRAAFRLHAGTLTATYALQLNLRKEADVVPEYASGAPQLDFNLRTQSLDVVFEHRPLALSSNWQLTGQAGVVGQVQRHLFDGHDTPELIPSYRQLGASAFLIERIESAHWEFDAGVRYDHIARVAQLSRLAYNKHASQGRLSEANCTLVRPGARALERAYECPTSFDAATASIGTTYRLGRDVSANLTGSSAARAPFVDEQYIDGSAPTEPIVAQGAPSLKLEKTWGLMATLTGLTSVIDAQLSAYVNYIDDYIYLAPELNANGTLKTFDTIRGAFPLRTHRPIDALYYGADGSLNVGRAWPVQVDAQFSAVWARDLTNNAFLLYVPPLRGRLAATYKPPGMWELRDAFARVHGLWVAKQTRFDLNADFSPPPPGYVLLGGEFGNTFAVGNDRMTVSLEVANALNTRYRDYTSLLRYFALEAGRTVFLRVAYQFPPTT